MVMVEFVLVEWVGEDATPQRVSFQATPGTGSTVIRLNDKVLTNVGRVLHMAKEANPKGLFLPYAPRLIESGIELRVLRDGFNL